MYSVVLLMSMTAAPEAPNFGGRLFHGCHGASSCHGCWSSGHGCLSSCHGWGGGVPHHWSWHGGCGGIVNYRGHGCWSSCHGCYGGAYAPYSCHGYGIYGGTSYTWPVPYHYSGSGCYGYGYPAIPVQPIPKIEDKKEKIGEPKKIYLPASPDRARVIVRLPDDAKLYANGQLTNLVSGERDFTTPNLEKGRDFQYAMKVEYVRDGKTITDSQAVRVRAGEVSVVNFADQTRVETVTSKVTVNLPQGAKLFVENQLRELPNGTKEFQTPHLQKGAEYAYSFRAELLKDGKTIAKTQRVVFKGGDPVNVDFAEMEVSTTASK